ncbi:SPOR domain-containing protein [Erwinia pyri]|uniref:Cell division protein DamX n=1 Tax=Erwinia pyri TaxID=3062598 RepID=A0AA50DLL0_9GAMM|nr:SPOR domain-containing protein [Erwinia sp. DE2]WLS79277.1 SPOR domain-containing protein [Erwinia sp. DE2]
MDEFKPEDELKPDTSDRRPQRSRKTSSAPKVPVSRQHMMMGIGILVLLLLVIGIGSALNSPDDSASKSAQQPSTPSGTSGAGSDKNIDLSGSSSMSGQNGTPAAPASTEQQQPASNAPQEISVPPISSTPTQAEPVQAPANQQRVELPGDLNNALSNQQGQVDVAAQGAQQSGSLPTAPATVAPGGNVSAPKAVTGQTHQNQPAAVHKPAPKPAATAKESRPKSSASASHTASEPARAASSAPAGSYTLQLSSASRSDTLNAWAKKQNLSSYHVYKTTRNGQPWYVLVSGSYATPAEAKRAVASLPAEVRAKSPWVKPVSQVKKEAAN